MYTVKNLSTSPENKSDDIETVITFSKLMEIIGEAMKKTDPKKPVPFSKFNHIRLYLCPECEEIIVGKSIQKYCGNCGQKLDWTDDKGCSSDGNGSKSEMMPGGGQ